MKLAAYDEHDRLHDVDALYFDGYHIAERLLEGLPIRISLDAGGNLVASADWPRGVDGAHWAREAVEFARDHDVFSTTPAMKDDDGVILTDEDAA